MPNQHTAGTAKVREVIQTIGPSIAYIPLTRGMFAVIDADDIPLVSGLNWNAHTSSARKRYYAARCVPVDGKMQTLFLHHLIYGRTPGKLTDHISGYTLDCRRVNLRDATPSQNCSNLRNLRANNKTGFRGVSLFKRDGTYQASITVNRKAIHLGYRSTPEEAYELRKEAARKYHGQFANV